MAEPIRDQWDIRECPRCGAGRGGPRGVHSHTATVWCLRCGWGQNVELPGGARG
ncbi:hypothetical protein GCM10010199_25200 [Dactylosporangium roseum]